MQAHIESLIRFDINDISGPVPVHLWLHHTTILSLSY